MCHDDSQQYDRICKQEFAEIKDAITSLDRAIRGNGGPGLNTRIDRLEQAEAKRGKIMIGVIVAVCASAIGLGFQLAIMCIDKINPQ